METNKHLAPGTKVAFSEPLNAEEAAMVYIVIELRGDRVLIEAQCNMHIKPQEVHMARDLTVL